MKYFPKVTGEKVYLSPISLDDAELYTTWLNDMETSRYLVLVTSQITLHGEREFLQTLSKAHNYAIVEKGTDKLLGTCGLMDIEDANRTAEVGIFIGPPEARGKGCGSEGLRLLCDYAFNALNLRSLMLRVYDYNERAIASYRKLGFREMGRRRKARFYGGGYHDMIYMDLLAEDFGPSVLPPAACSK